MHAVLGSFGLIKQEAKCWRLFLPLVFICLETLNLSVHDQQELTSASDTDMSLSSMIFPNTSSGSDSSVGEGEQSLVLDQSLVLVEPAELHAEQEECHSNVWRFYFGSSFESETGNSPVSKQVII